MFLLGEDLRVRVVRVDPEEAKIDLALESQPPAIQQVAPRKAAGPGRRRQRH
jgi:ribosomal protein S1